MVGLLLFSDSDCNAGRLHTLFGKLDAAAAEQCHGVNVNNLFLQGHLACLTGQAGPAQRARLWRRSS